MADGLTMDDIQTEAAAKQRAFESQQAKASTSGRGANTGKPHCADMQLTFRMSQGICTPAEI